MNRLFWPAFSAALMLAVLIGLGSWQVQRLHWKERVIAEIAERMAAAPVALPVNAVDPQRWNYRRVHLTGRFRHDLERHLKANGPDGAPGYHILTPFLRPQGPAVIVDRGWVPDAFKDAASRPAGQISGVVTISGIVRAPTSRGWFVPDNEPARNLWFHVTPGDLAADLHMELAPVLVDADATPNPGGWPLGGQTHLDIPNNHLQYAITWYALAAVLVAMFWIFARKPRRP